MGEEFTLEDALIIIQRRALALIIPAVVLAIAGIGLVMALPAKYTAQGTILVESAQIPSELVRSTINTYAQERIQMIRQRVMTRNRLLEIADKYQLFPKDSGLSESARVQKMRERLRVSVITADGARSHGQRDATIAFTVSYVDGNAEKAFKVANEFMTLFLSEDVRTRTAGASNTTEFFKQETQRISTSVDGIEQRIAEYKVKNANALPEHLNLHLDMLERATRDLASDEAAIAALEEELRFLESQLTSYFAGSSFEEGPAQELARLKSELVQLRSVYRDAHPNVQAVRDQIRALESELTPSKEIQDLQSALADAETELKTAERSLEPDDPAIADLRAAVEDVQTKLSDRIAKEAQSGGGDFLSAQLQGRIAVARSRRSLLANGIEETKEAIADLQLRVARTPEVERGLQALTRDYDNIFREYQDVLAKQQEAQLAENLEDNQKAEKFSILEPAQPPDKPSSPERVKLSVLVLFVSIAAGVACAIGAELFMSTIRGRRHIERLIDGHPIAVIPHFRRDGERRFSLPFTRNGPAAAPAE